MRPRFRVVIFALCLRASDWFGTAHGVEWRIKYWIAAIVLKNA